MERSHFLSDLGWSQVLLDEKRALLQVPLGIALPTPGGEPALGIMLTLLDVIGSDPAMASSPADWMATRDAVVHATGPVGTGPVVVDAVLERAGSGGVVVSGTAYDGGGESDLDRLRRAIDEGALPRIGTGLITFARIPRAAAAGMDDYNPGQWIGQQRTSRRVSTPDSSVYDRMQVARIGPGSLDLELSPYVTNSIGTVTGGAQAALAELAAVDLRPDLRPTGLQVHFLAQVRSGPVRSLATLLRDDDGAAVASVRLVDAGDDDRLIALCTVTLGA